MLNMSMKLVAPKPKAETCKGGNKKYKYGAISWYKYRCRFKVDV